MVRILRMFAGLLPAMVLFHAPALHAQGSLGLLFDEKDTTITATESRRALGNAPAIVTVITEKQIKDMGIHRLIEALESVPGMHVSYPSDIASGHTLTVRGLKTSEAENTLLMINGHRVNNPYSGSWTFLFDEFPLADVRRIEVIRGPGSALYGSNAVVAVINVITKNASDFHDSEAVYAAGNHATQIGHVAIGSDNLSRNFMLSLDATDTAGDRDKVRRDAAGNSGRTNFWRRQQSGFVSLESGEWSLFAMHLNKRRGSLLDATNRIDHGTNVHVRQSFATLTWRHEQDDWDVELRGDGDLFELDPRWQTFGGPSSLRTQVKNLTLSAQALFRYRGWTNHEWTLSGGYDHIRQFDVRTFSSGVDVTASKNHNRNTTRGAPALVLQDVWTPLPRLSLTAGLRGERFTDVGGHVSPRLAMVWSAAPGLDVKFMYARAFRAPNFIELYSANNPSILGNAAARPEVTDSFEIGASWSNGVWRLSANAFYNRLRDRLARISPGITTVNVGRTDLEGAEAEIRVDADKDLYASIGYMFQRGEDKTSGVSKTLPDVPRHILRLSGDMPLPFDIHLHGDMHWLGRQQRASGDSRPPVGSTMFADLALRAGNSASGLSGSFVVENIFNRRVLSPVAKTGMSDLRIFEREWLLQLAYVF